MLLSRHLLGESPFKYTHNSMKFWNEASCKTSPNASQRSSWLASFLPYVFSFRLVHKDDKKCSSRHCHSLWYKKTRKAYSYRNGDQQIPHSEARLNPLVVPRVFCLAATQAYLEKRLEAEVVNMQTARKEVPNSLGVEGLVELPLLLHNKARSLLWRHQRLLQAPLRPLKYVWKVVTMCLRK